MRGKSEGIYIQGATLRGEKKEKKCLTLGDSHRAYSSLGNMREILGRTLKKKMPKTKTERKRKKTHAWRLAQGILEHGKCEGNV